MSTKPDTAAAQPWADHKVAFVAGTYDTRLNTGEDYATRTLAQIFAMRPDALEKLAGPAFIPSTYHDYDARSHDAQAQRGQYVALTADIDSGNHDAATVQVAVAAFVGDHAYTIYSSPHAHPGDKRWRVIVPLATPTPFEAWHDAQTAFFAFLGSKGVATDAALARAGQLVFLPNVPAVHGKTGIALRGPDGAPLYFRRHASPLSKPGLDLAQGIVADGMAEIARRRAEDERERDQMRAEAAQRRANKPARDGDNPTEAFNATNSVESMLEMCGYERSPISKMSDWRSPYQQGQTYATRVMDDAWFSLSQSDVDAGVGQPCRQGCFGDAYDLYVHFKHGGDHKAAWRAIGQELGANVIRPTRFNPPEWMQEAPMPDEMPDWAEAYGDDIAAEFEDQVAEQPRELSLLPVIDFNDWAGKTPPERQFAWGDNIPLGTTTMLTGPGGVGKSLFEQMLCTCIALGVPFLGVETRQMNTLYVTCEDDADELWRRQTGICAALKVPVTALRGKLHLVSLCGEQETALATFDEKEQIELTDRWRQLVHTCEQAEIQLYAFDNATDAMAGDLNSIHQVAEFVNLLTGLALRLGGAAMILHHPNKAGDDWLGSVAWHNKVRSRLIIKRSDIEGDDDGRLLENPKANYGPSGGKLSFRWFKGAFIADQDLPEDFAAELQDSIRASSFNRKFLECLERVTDERRNVSHARSAANFAPRVFAAMTIGRGYDEKGLAAAMERLLHLGAIKANQKVFQYDNRTWANGLKAVEEDAE